MVTSSVLVILQAAAGGSTVTSLTLANTDNGVQHAGPFDTFIMNHNSNEISMSFSGLEIYSVSFDYEIFPDGTCPTGHHCGSNWPDLTFKADGADIATMLGVIPGQPGGSLYTHSPDSGRRIPSLRRSFSGRVPLIPSLTA